MKRIVVGVDGSDNAARALRWAVEEARIRKTSVEAVMAWDFLEQRHLQAEAEFDPEYDDIEAQRVVEGFIEAEVDEADRELVEAVSICGQPADVLLTEAANASLLVVGARGIGAFRRAILGSVSDSCVRSAPVPVVVVPTDDHSN